MNDPIQKTQQSTPSIPYRAPIGNPLPDGGRLNSLSHLRTLRSAKFLDALKLAKEFDLMSEPLLQEAKRRLGIRNLSDPEAPQGSDLFLLIFDEPIATRPEWIELRTRALDHLIKNPSQASSILRHLHLKAGCSKVTLRHGDSFSVEGESATASQSQGDVITRSDHVYGLTRQGVEERAKLSLALRTMDISHYVPGEFGPIVLERAPDISADLLSSLHNQYRIIWHEDTAGCSQHFDNPHLWHTDPVRAIESVASILGTENAEIEVGIDPRRSNYFVGNASLVVDGNRIVSGGVKAGSHYTASIRACHQLLVRLHQSGIITDPLVG